MPIAYVRHVLSGPITSQSGHNPILTIYKIIGEGQASELDRIVAVFTTEASTLNGASGPRKSSPQRRAA